MGGHSMRACSVRIFAFVWDSVPGFRVADGEN